MTALAASPALLIAVTGTPGEGRTRLLAEFASERRASGVRVEGVLAAAGERAGPAQGAGEYRLQIIGEPADLPWAERDESLSPPYRFDPVTQRKLRVWADGLHMQEPASLLILDEFGKFEARGEGLMPLWPTLAAAAPHVAVLAVRSEHVEEIEARLGRAFDVRIAARSPDALERLRQACSDYGEWTQLGLMGGAAGGIEVTIGSALHAAKIPARGLLMSSVQGAMMTFAGFGLSQPGRVVWLPLISAGLKALSPAGSRIRPMIAICAQGLLYGTTVQILGWNVPAVAVAGGLVGGWSALQGFFLQYLLMGEELVRAYDSTVLWLAENWQINAPTLPWLVGGWALFCAVFAAAVSITAWRLRGTPASLQRMIDRERAQESNAPARRHGRLRELLHWQFWLPLLLVSSITLAAGRSWEQVAWLALRFVAVALVLLAVVSVLRPARWATHLRRFGWWGPAAAFAQAMRRRE